MNNFILANTQFTTPSIIDYTRQPIDNRNPTLLKLVCHTVGHQPLNIGNNQIIGTYPGTGKLVYVQHRICKRCNRIINSVNTVVDHA